MSRTVSGRSARTALTIAFAALLLASGCAGPKAPDAEPAPAVPAGSIVFDMAHGEVFGADDTSDLGQSGAVQRMRDAGFRVDVNTQAINDDTLSQASGLVIAGPMRPLLDEEYDAIAGFLRRGGTVLLTIHVPMPVQKVPAHWGLPVGSEVIRSDRPLADAGDPSVFVADEVEPSRVTEGVERVVVVSGWPVGAVSADAELVVSTSSDTWTEPMSATGGSAREAGPFGIVGVTRVGDGLVVVSGDDAIFGNVALDQADNARLLDNIIGLMSEMTDV